MKQSGWARIADGTEGAEANLRQVEQEHSGRCAGGRRKSMLGLGLGMALVVAVAGCHKTPAQDPAAAQVDQNAGDPADANMAPVDGGTGYAAPAQPARVLGQNVQYQQQQQGEDYTQQQAAPIERRAPDADGQSYSTQGDPNSSAQDGQNYATQNGDSGYDNGQYDTQQADDAYAADLTDAEANDPPPPLPYYEQPPAPEPDYLWTPGYWAWGGGGYYWVPGGWVAAPYTGALWTPGYWGYVGNRYHFHHGFWGLHIGFYGGVDYGYGYVGHGYYGGFWDRDHFRYNTAVNRVNVNVIHNVYVHNVVINNVVVNNRIVNRVSYSGGRGGVQARPMAAEIAVLHEQRNAPMAAQVQVQREAAQNRAQFYSQNHGRPAVAVNARALVADRTPSAVLPRVVVPMARPVQPVNQPGNQVRPGNQMQGGLHGVQPGQAQGWQQRQQQNNGVPQQPGNRPVAGQPQVQPQQPSQAWQQRQQQNNQVRPTVSQPLPAAGQPQMTPGQPQSQYRQGLPQTQERGLQQQGNRPVVGQPQVQSQQPTQNWQQRQQQNNLVRPTVAQPLPAAGPPQATPGQPQSQYRPAPPQMQQRGLQPENRPTQPQPDMQNGQQRQGWQQRQQNNEVRPTQPQPEARPAPPVQARPQEQMRPQQQAAPQPRPQQQEQHAAPPPHAPEAQPQRDGKDHH